MSQATLEHIHLNESGTTSISALGQQIDQYLAQYSDISDGVVKELHRFLEDYRRPLREFEDSGLLSNGNQIHTFFLPYARKLSDRLVTGANKDEDLATVWSNFADESGEKKMKLATNRLGRVRKLKDKFPGWPTENLETLIGNCMDGTYFKQRGQRPDTNEAGGAENSSYVTIDPLISTDPGSSTTPSIYTGGGVEPLGQTASLKRPANSLDSDVQPSLGKKARAENPVDDKSDASKSAAVVSDSE